MNAKTLLIFLLILSTSLFAQSQVINLKLPQGTYYLNDNEGKEYKLILKPIIRNRSTSYYNCGKAELIRLGENTETFYGHWIINTKYNASPAELNFVNIEFSEVTDLYLQSGFCCQTFTISKDGWVYPDMFQCMDENPKHRVKISKVPIKKQFSN